MIIDKLENFELYSGISNRIKMAVEHLLKKDYSKTKPGKYELLDDTMFVIVNEYNTRENELNILEAHKRYIDFQYMLEGTEVIEYEMFDKHQIHQDYNKDDDYTLFKTRNISKVRFSEGMFSILFPNDLHMPGIIDGSESKVKKVVIKIRID